jgi:hypothetical protein
MLPSEALLEIIESLDRYVKHGVPTGDFLRAVIANDLVAAIARADLDNVKLLGPIASAMLMRVPNEARGSYEAFDAWVAKHNGVPRSPEEEIIRTHLAMFGVKPTDEFVERTAKRLREMDGEVAL